jgi:RHS repeat-associated protein
MLTPSTPLAEALVWRSRRLDPTGYYRLGSRYYDPMAGRFISADPLGHSGSWDLYSFCNGDPLNRFDPTGRLGKNNLSLNGSGDWYHDNVIAPIFQRLDDLSYNDSPAGQFVQGYQETQGNDWWMQNSGYFEAPEDEKSSFDLNEALVNAVNVATFGIYNDATIAVSRAYNEVTTGGSLARDAYGNLVTPADQRVPIFNTILTAATFGIGPAMSAAERAAQFADGLSEMFAADTGGMANLHYYSSESLGQEAPHFSIETLGQEGMHTHQVITGPTSTTMVPVEGLPPPTATIPVSLADPAAAQALQAQRLGVELGPYNMRNNSCLTTAADILRAGGADIPANNVQLRIWVKGKLQ